MFVYVTIVFFDSYHAKPAFVNPARVVNVMSSSPPVTYQYSDLPYFDVIDNQCNKGTQCHVHNLITVCVRLCLSVCPHTIE